MSARPNLKPNRGSVWFRASSIAVTITRHANLGIEPGGRDGRNQDRSWKDPVIVFDLHDAQRRIGKRAVNPQTENRLLRVPEIPECRMNCDHAPKYRPLGRRKDVQPADLCVLGSKERVRSDAALLRPHDGIREEKFRATDGCSGPIAPSFRALWRRS
ncbi:hypothetical protein N5A93_19095 [Roseovarius sp. EGI FJ00037]|uniref:hypothetical protein n=1 Tax=Roseovarius salincola TaxID=2978479 RepID=UPI0022A85E8F|nr:hypothetical protein [Roseovarius sp. EGI FJ00037]MCZ0814330.1 hypothetical protein [Roseovarius sp. EGI FJ00037]